MMQELLIRNFLGNPLSIWLLFAAAFASCVIVIIVVNLLLFRPLQRLVKRANKSFQSKLLRKAQRGILTWAFLMAGWSCLQLLTWNAVWKNRVDAVFLVLATVLGVGMLVSFLSLIMERKWLSGEDDLARRQTIRGIETLVRVVVWSLAIFLLLDNFGFNISTLLAGLGIGGIAIALAAQTVLGDLFSCFVIYFDKPFAVGDTIAVDTFIGTIEHVGLKTTRIRSVNGEQLVFPNTNLTSSRIRNLRRMDRRRVEFQLCVPYDTPSAKLESIPTFIREIIASSEQVTMDRSHFSEFGDSGYLIDTVFYIDSSDYNVFMDTRQAINLRILAAFEEHGISFAIPTRQVQLRNG